LNKNNKFKPVARRITEQNIMKQMKKRIINGLTVNIDSEKSNFGSGKKTVYSGNFTKDGQTVNFEDKAIDALKVLCGIPRTTNSKRTIRVNSVDEIDTKSTLKIL
jgi:hypothetical protein